MSESRGDIFRRERERLQSIPNGPKSQNEFVEIREHGVFVEVMDRSLLSVIENWERGKGKRKVTPGMLSDWYRCYEYWCGMCGVRLRITKDMFGELISSPSDNEVLAADLLKDENLSHILFWGHSHHHEHVREGVKDAALEVFGKRPAYFVCGGDEEKFIEALAAVKATHQHILLEGPCIVVKGAPDLASLENRYPIIQGERRYRQHVFLGERHDWGLRPHYQVYDSLDELGGSVFDLASACKPRRLVLIGGLERGLGMNRASKVRFNWQKRPRALRATEFVWINNRDLTANEVRQQLAAAVKGFDERKRCVVVAPTYDAADLACDMAVTSLKGMYLITADLSPARLRPLRELGERWTGSVVYDHFLNGMTAVMMLRHAILREEGVLTDRQHYGEHLKIPPVVVRGKDCPTKVLWEDIRRSYLLPHRERWSEAHAWLGLRDLRCFMG